jgi:hypothetical protein
MKKKKIMVGLAGGIALLLTGASAQAMTFTRHHVNDSANDTIDMVGDIEHGDANRLKAFLSSLTNTGNIIGFRFNSAGGYIAESVEMADIISNTHLATMVPDGAICASACFFLFSAGQQRSVSSTARVGVHGVSGSDKSDSMTIIMAKVLKEVGRVPDSVIVKMVTTPSSEVAWLDRSDFAAMNVRIVERAVASAPPPPSVQLPQVPHYGAQFAPTTITSRANVSTSFADGRSDRIVLQQWADSLTGQYKAGAEWWASVRSTPHPTRCEDQVNMNPTWNAAWVQGCVDARVKFTPYDARRNAEPDYKAGWNQASSELQAGATSAPASSTSRAFEDGRRDRLAFEQWINGLPPDEREGALWWAEMRSNKPQPLCTSVPNPVNDYQPGRVYGCGAAQNRLYLMDARRKTEPDYKAGWNQASEELEATPLTFNNEGHCGNGRPDAPPCIVSDSTLSPDRRGAR